MFNDRYGLTGAVISGRKTETRRIEFVQSRKAIELSNGSSVEEDIKGREALMSAMARYKVGDILAVTQSYKDAGVNPEYIRHACDGYSVARLDKQDVHPCRPYAAPNTNHRHPD